MPRTLKPRDPPPVGLAIGKRCVHVHTRLGARRANGWEYHTEEREVRLLAIAGNWAMVRRSGAIPYCCMLKELRSDIQAAGQQVLHG